MKLWSRMRPVKLLKRSSPPLARMMWIDSEEAVRGGHLHG